MKSCPASRPAREQSALKAAQKKQDDDNDQDDAKDADATATVAVPVAPEMAAEPAQQKMIRMIARISPSDMMPYFWKRSEGPVE